MADASGLVVHGLSKHFGGVHAVRGVDLQVLPGECVALIGPNGAGKSTTFACIAGQVAASSGQIVWNGVRVDTLPPARRLQTGIARTFQVAQTFDALTALQSVQLLLPGTPVWSPWQALDAVAPETAMALLRSVGLQEHAAQEARHLPYGAKKRLELAMALAGMESNSSAEDAHTGLLLLDEPAAGLAAQERAALMTLVHGLTRKTEGGRRLAVLYTEHNMDAVFGVADRVLVLMEGRMVASGTAQEVAANDLVRSRYLGQSFRLKKEAPGA